VDQIAPAPPPAPAPPNLALPNTKLQRREMPPEMAFYRSRCRRLLGGRLFAGRNPAPPAPVQLHHRLNPGRRTGCKTDQNAESQKNIKPSPIPLAQVTREPASYSARPCHRFPLLRRKRRFRRRPRIQRIAQEWRPSLNKFWPDVPQKPETQSKVKIKVKVRVHVDAPGDVVAAELDSPGPSKYFAQLALQAAQRWKFTPAQTEGPTLRAHGCYGLNRATKPRRSRLP